MRNHFLKIWSLGIYERRIWMLVLLVFLNLAMRGNIKSWTGGAGDGLWSSPTNWTGDSVPFATDDVMLDNSLFTENYTVTLPDVSVTLKTLTIFAQTGKTILLLLPTSNLNTPGFSATGPGYGIDIESGGIFQNSSGIASGESLLIADSIRIGDGGKYIHHTRAAHANNIVRLLSSSPGTSLGVFEFDVPRSAYTISASNRMYGTLAFSAIAAGGAITYTCNGSNPLTIHGNLQINLGVTFSVDLGGVNGNILIEGDFVQNGGVFNLASGAGNSTIARIQGNLIQSSGAQITESNSGQPVLEIGGTSLQIISLAGIIQNEVSFRMNNPAGAILLSPLQLPYQLQLIRGKISGSSSNLLTLQANCSIMVDSSFSNSSYVDGPLRKEGLSASPYFLFPVGKSPSLRWLELKNATGNFTVEYIRTNPGLISNFFGLGIDHVSSEEFWTVNTDPIPGSQAAVELSFADPASGSITDLSSLRVAEYNGTMWMDVGQSATTGVLGGDGSITSNPLSGIVSEIFFTLGSSLHLENPLPVKLISFSGFADKNLVTLNWKVDLSADAERFDIFGSTDAKNFYNVGELVASPNSLIYQWISTREDPLMKFYKIQVIEKTGNAWFSCILDLNDHETASVSMKLWPSFAETVANLEINSEEENLVELRILAIDGKTLNRSRWPLSKGKNLMTIAVGGFPPGVYLVAAYDQRGKFLLAKFVKK
ncbi:MAG: hypothetical protein ACHQET_04010 [Chitinophagales bacterium]